MTFTRDRVFRRRATTLPGSEKCPPSMKKPKRKSRSPYFMSRSGWVVGIGLSGTVFFIGVYFGVSSIIEGQGTERTDGTVVRLQQQGSGSDVSYRPVVEYDVNGKTYH